ncbi:two-component system, OmpR family, alkaline phosphatase synthesis response regulator PhoP [Catalinimonas alkaloidigena]|uniref:Phosphate regulon transcriptional regulatory protein PhoB n=1 Tax=Catalinimonas alkaloidigena TaxID=1075417 RepID=A0A1G8ZN08_9BACT|nr:response regulator transcription factor [Catalinimonas alkaloidigena]SDK16417.1 two-component system, OmpR family, alkaline phosphatase synthesis response regulator PhoP [Catalinimonas alkaloidigena]
MSVTTVKPDRNAVSTGKAKYKVLIVDDESDILELLQYNFEREGYEVRTAENGRKAVEILKEFQPHLVVLDIMMPQMDGVETCRQMRELPQGKEIYIIFLTARTEEYSEVAAFDVGADDFITKPIKPRALMSRVAALFRRSGALQQEGDRLIMGNLTIDRSSYTITHDGQQMTLPKKEFELLYFLAQNPNKVFSRDDLLQNIWGNDVYVLARTVDVHIRKVREKIGEGYIHTVKGVGYKFELSEA